MLPPLSTIRERRKKLGWTQKTLATRAGVSQSTIAKIENGRLVPNYHIVQKIFEALEQGEKGTKSTTVGELMGTRVITATPYDDIKTVIDKMKLYAISQIPVLDDSGALVGMITESDIIHAYEKHGSHTPHLKVGEVMGAPPPTVRVDTRIEGALALLKQYPALVVMHETGIKGIITKSDIIYMGLNL